MLKEFGLSFEETPLAIYTCMDMIEGCRNRQPQAWRHFIRHYVPAIQWLLEHYAPTCLSPQRVLEALHRTAGDLFAQAVTEREFIARLRQSVLAVVEQEAPDPQPGVPTDLETLAQALAPLTVIERQMFWFETMAYTDEATASILNLQTATIAALRARAAELLGAGAGRWSRPIPAEYGRWLGRQAARAATPDCLPPKAFLDLIDGRMTWKRKHDYEHHLSVCWHCVDHFCRLREADHVTQVIHPLSEEAARPLEATLGLTPARQSFWQRFSPRWSRIFAWGSRRLL